MILSFINIPKIPREGRKPRVLPSVFNTSLGTLQNVNEWRIMFDPSIVFVFKQNHRKRISHLCVTGA